MKTNIVNCARCGKDHGDLIMTELKGESIELGALYKIITHFTMCPTLNQPILISIK